MNFATYQEFECTETSSFRAGVIGLTTALTLVTTYPQIANRVQIIAKHIPGDHSPIEYASPWAGANFSSIAPNNPAALAYDRHTYSILLDLARKKSEATGIAITPACEYWSDTPDEAFQHKIHVWSEFVEGFRELAGDELCGYKYGIGYTSVTINSPKYLSYLSDQVRSLGVTIQRFVLSSLNEGFTLYSARVIINCTGLSSRQLAHDPKVHPVRGQVVLVKNSHTHVTLALHKSDSLTYIIPRPGSGTVVLGGYYQPDVYDADTFADQTQSILSRANALLPDLTHNKGVESFEVVRESAGLRPARHGGARIAREEIVGDDTGTGDIKDEGKRWIVHNYGAAGAGYQASYGMAKAAVQLFPQGVL